MSADGFELRFVKVDPLGWHGMCETDRGIGAVYLEPANWLEVATERRFCAGHAEQRLHEHVSTA